MGTHIGTTKTTAQTHKRWLLSIGIKHFIVPTFVIQDGIVPSLNDFVPEDNLIQFVIISLVLGGQIQKELFHIPVEEVR